MLQLNTWLKLYGTLKYDSYWLIYPYPRVETLLEIWEGPWIPSKTRRKLIITIDSDEFDGELLGNWRHIQSELERMDFPIYDLIRRWKRLGATDKELDIIDSILNNLHFDVTELDKVRTGQN